MSSTERMALARYIMHNCLMVRVTVSDRDGGYAAFRVLNERGKKLSAHDILKSDLYSNAQASMMRRPKRMPVTWNEIGARLGSNGFDDLTQADPIAIRQGVQGRHGDGVSKPCSSKRLRSGIHRRSIAALCRRVWNYHRNAQTRHCVSAPLVIQYIDHMRALDHAGWRAPALKYLVDGDSGGRQGD